RPTEAGEAELEEDSQDFERRAGRALPDPGVLDRRAHRPAVIATRPEAPRSCPSACRYAASASRCCTIVRSVLRSWANSRMPSDSFSVAIWSSFSIQRKVFSSIATLAGAGPGWAG